MKPTAMQKSAETEGDKTMPAISVTPRPKHSTTISVGENSNNVRSPSSASITSPLQCRLSGELIQILGDRDGPSASRGANVTPVTANDDRKNTPTLIASRGYREPVLLKTSSTRSMKPPMLTLSSSLTPSAKSLHSQSSTSPLKSPVIVASASPAVRSAHNVAFPRSNSGSSAMISPDTVSDKMNGYLDNSINSDTESYQFSDFYASLPSLPADDFVSRRQSASPPLESQPMKLIVISPSPQPTPPPPTPPSSLELPQREAASLQSEADKLVPVSSSEAIKTVPASSSPPRHQAQTSETRRPKTKHHRKSKKAPRPPPMSGIAENRACLDGGSGERSADGCGAMEIPPETFHVNVRNTPQSAGETVAEEGQEETSFAGQRDLRDARSLKEKRILGATGTVRGFKNRVRVGIATFIDQTSKKFNYRAVEKGQIVMYITTMTIVRETYERCRSARNILHTHMVRYEQRDVYLSHEHQRQLRGRLDSAHEVPLPQIFIDGQHLGGALELEKLNESGELRKILHRFPKIQMRGMCEACGGFRFVPCEVCHGSKKSLYRNHFTEEFSALRCTHCNENGLQRCLHCIKHTAE